MNDPIHAGEAAEQALGKEPEAPPEPFIKVPVFGRPTLYRPEFCEEVVRHGAEGLSRVQIAAELMVSRQTLHDWEKAYPDFLDAMTRARDLSQAWFEKMGQRGLRLPTKEFNTALWAKQVSNRFREDYTDRKEVEHSGSGFALIVHDQPRKRD